MKPLKIRVAEKIYVVFSTESVNFLRGSQAVKEVVYSFSNGIGQTIAAGEVFYTSGTDGSSNYLQVKSAAAYTLNGAGNISLSVTHYPLANATNKSINFDIAGTNVTLAIAYNSAPVVQEIVINTGNRTPYIFTSDDFLDYISDVDNDTITDIQLIGDLTGYTLNDQKPVSGVWISIDDIDSGLLKYTPLDQDAAYEKTVDYNARDINGNVSN